MKRICKTLVVLCLTVFAFTNIQAQSENGLIGKARAAVQQCLLPYAGSNVQASVSPSGECGHIVTFTSGPRCTGNGPCPFFVILVATVEFDCDGNIISTTCN